MSYKDIEDILHTKTDYNQIMTLKKNDIPFGVRICGVSSICKYENIDRVRKLLGNGVKVWYDNNREFIEINIL